MKGHRAAPVKAGRIFMPIGAESGPALRYIGGAMSEHAPSLTPNPTPAYLAALNEAQREAVEALMRAPPRRDEPGGRRGNV